MKSVALSVGAMCLMMSWGCGGAELDAQSPEPTDALEQRGGTTDYSTPPTPTTGTQTYTRTGITSAQCTVTQRVGRSLDGTKMYSHCVVNCKQKANILMYNTLYNYLPGQSGQGITCGSSTAGGLDRTGQSVECSGPYAQGGYTDTCWVRVRVKDIAEQDFGSTPVWQF